MRKLTLISFLILLSSGCHWFKRQPVEPVIDVIVHPLDPRAIAELKSVEWRVVQNEKGIFVTTDYDSFLDHLKGQEDVLRYIRDANAVICFYRNHFMIKTNVCEK